MNKIDLPEDREALVKLAHAMGPGDYIIINISRPEKEPDKFRVPTIQEVLQSSDPNSEEDH